MKRILVTGENSYIGTSFKKWILQYPEKYSVDLISMRDDYWKQISFSKYDVVFHTAAIVHVKEKDKSMYYKINRDLTIELARKAKREGVKQFIFLSTMGVYGTEMGYITQETIPSPKTPYAKSKYEAEKLLEQIDDKNFKIVILRPPLVYGKDCPGNYKRLANLVIKSPFFPEINNYRSMIYINNLSEFVKVVIDYDLSGLYFPQNTDYVNITKLVRLISNIHGKKIKVSRMFNFIIKSGLKFSGSLRKVFGTFVYDKKMPGSSGVVINSKIIKYETINFEESIKETEKLSI